MNQDCLKLTTYFGERDRAGPKFLADALLDVYERHGFETSVLLRGVEGFGVKHRMHTDRLLTLSEDLPIVSIAVDTRERIQAALPEVRALSGDGLITLERARMLTGAIGPVDLSVLRETTKLTVYLGRVARIDGRPAYLAVVDLLRRRGIDGATVLLGVDGTAHGVRRRARFFGRNADVPLMVIAVGESHRVAAVLSELGALLERPLFTLERVGLCKRDGLLLAEPPRVAGRDASGLASWQKLMVFTSEQAKHDGRPLHGALIRRLRAAQASGATALRGVLGYHGGGEPQRDTFWTLRRRVPVVTVVVDTPPNIRRLFSIVHELTGRHGLVTSEVVPALRAAGPGTVSGGLELARPRAD